MRKSLILTTIMTLVILIGFSGCGNTEEGYFVDSNSSSGGTTGGTDTNTSSATIIDIDVDCVTPATISAYISLQSGDTIVKNQTDTTIETYHDSNGTKKVCLVSGSASIVR